jgi:phage shock protein PspC (stress-responsive transcriptional regulator)
MFGVCEALGRTLGISPNWFRVAFAAAVIFNLEYAVAAYAAIGALVLIAHLVHPGRKVAAVDAVAAPAQIEASAPVAEAPAKVALFAEAA